jgi:hypothetical protein
VKDTVHDTKKAVHDLANKTENMQIKDAPDRLLPSVDVCSTPISFKCEILIENLENRQKAREHTREY